MLIRSLHITLIFCLLTSSIGLVVNQHYCKDELKRVSFFVAVKSCHEEKDKKQIQCPHHRNLAKHTNLEKKDCCNNTSQFFKSQQEQTLQGAFMLPDSFQNAICSLTDQQKKSLFPRVLNGIYYRPPPLAKKIPSFLQVFRL